jgi:hypothetical protein
MASIRPISPLAVSDQASFKTKKSRFVAGGGGNSAPGPLEGRDKVANLLMDRFGKIDKLHFHPRQKEMAFRLVPNPNDFGFGRVLLMGLVR